MTDVDAGFGIGAVRRPAVTSRDERVKVMGRSKEQLRVAARAA
jgi:hypothetical protein